MYDELIYKKRQMIANYIIIFTYATLIIVGIVNNFTETVSQNKDINILLALITAFISSLLDNYIITIAFITYKLASRKIYKSKLDETDFEKNKDLYRNIIANYNTSTLNYIYNFKLDLKQSYTAKLLELQRKKIILIEDNTIRIINEPKEEIDIKFINSIKNNKITMSLDEYESYCEKDALSNELLKANITNKQLKYIIITFITSIILLPLFIVGGLIFILTFKNFYPNIIPSVIIIIAVICIILTIISVSSFTYGFTFLVKGDQLKYIRTQKGKAINRQLEGLKNFMKEFGNVNQKESQSLIL